MTPGCLARTVSQGKWKWSPHLRLLDQAVVDLVNGRINPPRLMVEMPPRHGKSEHISHYTPPWFLGTFPDKNVILTSATDDLAMDWSVMGRDLMEEYGRELFNVEVRKDIRAASRWQLSAGGSMRAAGVAGGIMGRGSDLLIIDDYFKNASEAYSESHRESIYKWYLSTSSTRLTPDGAIIIVATRWHLDDLIGKLLADQERGGEKWVRIRFPALAEEHDVLGRSPGDPLWPDRFGLQWLNDRKAAYVASGYAWMWEALYQQNPPMTLDVEWPAEYFFEEIWFTEWPPEEEIAWKILALDPSVGTNDKSDYSAFIKLAITRDLKLYVEADIQRRDIFKMMGDGLDIVSTWRPQAFGIEAVQFQAVLAPVFWLLASQRGLICYPYGISRPPQISKRQRIRSTLTEPLARGHIKFKTASPGTKLLVDQLRGFPSCSFDDGPDALEMAVTMAIEAVNGTLVTNTESFERILV